MGRVKIHYGIMHVPTPERVRLVSDMKRELGDADYTVAEDPDRHGPWSTARALLEHGLSQDCTHVSLLEDDLILCDKFVQVSHAAVSAVPKEVVSFYCNTPVAPAAIGAGLSWVTRYDGTGMYCAPKRVIRDFLKFMDLAYPKPLLEYGADAPMDFFCMATERLHWTPAVSLVEHDDALPSLLGNERHAHRRAVVPPYKDMTRIDWKTDAAFGGLTRGNHWCLAEMTQAGLAKYPVHKLMYHYDRIFQSGKR
jgi:hypothetical protein